LNIKTINGCSQACNCPSQPNRNLNDLSFKGLPSKTQQIYMRYCYLNDKPFSQQQEAIIKANGNTSGKYSYLADARRETAKQAAYTRGAYLKYLQEGKEEADFDAFRIEGLKLYCRKFATGILELCNSQVHLPQLKLPKFNLVHKLASFL